MRELTVVDEFADAVESGKDDGRPAFQRLIALKAAGSTWDHVLCWQLPPEELKALFRLG